MDETRHALSPAASSSDGRFDVGPSQPVSVVVRTLPWTALLSFSLVLLVFVGQGVLLYRVAPQLAAHVLPKVMPALFAAAAALGALLLFFLQSYLFPLSVRSATLATVTPGELVLRDRPPILRSRIRGGHYRRAGFNAHVLVLRFDDGELLIQCQDDASGERLLTALDLDRATVRFRAIAKAQTRNLMKWLPIVPAVFLPLQLLASENTMYVMGVTLVAMAVFVRARNSDAWWKGKAIDVGVDGIFVQAPGVSRFISYAEVEDLEPTTGVLTLRAAPKVVLAADVRDGAALFYRIRQGLARSRANAPAPARARVFTTASPREAYRSDALSSDDAFAVLDDSTAPEAQRVAAAAWLALAPDRKAAVSRVRVLAHETASPRVRFALEDIELARDEEPSDDSVKGHAL